MRVSSALLQRSSSNRPVFVHWLVLASLFAAGCFGGDSDSTSADANPVRMTAAAFVENGLDAEGTVIDVRTPEEFAEQHLRSARNIDFRSASFQEQIEPLDRSGRYYLYCRTGNRSGQAAALMSKMGFRDVVNIGGLAELVDAGAPTG